ncbi:MAG: cation:proton antiporter [Candidatus Nanohaloarchaea archaeon]
MAETELILIVITIFALGIASQILADKYKIPSIIFLLTAGILTGPEGLNIVNPDAFGAGLQLVVGLSVSIIVFEGAFHLKLSKLKAAQNEAVMLGTVGAVLSCVLTAVAAFYTLNVSWGIAFLIGALLIATGPTVIKPILDVVHVRQRVEAALETEGIVNDVTAAILALVVYEFVVLESMPFSSVASHFITRWGSGVFIGIMAAAAAWYLLTQIKIDSSKQAQEARIIILGTALISWGLAELVLTEAGIAAAATAGLILGNLDIPYKKEIKDFEDAVSVLVLSFVFIALAALLTFEDLIALGAGGLLFILAVTLIIRPLTVYFSTRGGSFNNREKVFISLVGPRGIIPASVATLFALELQNMGRPDAAATIVGAVFLIILATSFVEGGLAKMLARKLDVIPMHTIIVGAGEAGLGLAERLDKRGENVVIIDSDSSEVEKARKKGFNAIHGDGRDIDVLENAEADKAKIVAATTHDDDVNIVVAQMAKSKFDIENIIARVNEPENKTAFEDLDVNYITSPDAIVDAFENILENPALWKQLTEHRDNIEIGEIEIQGNIRLSELEDEMPPGSMINLITRNREGLNPEEVEKLRRGDIVTIMGRKKAVKKAIELF